jgi:hypothetical protein
MFDPQRFSDWILQSDIMLTEDNLAEKLNEFFDLYNISPRPNMNKTFMNSVRQYMMATSALK